MAAPAPGGAGATPPPPSPAAVGEWRAASAKAGAAAPARVSSLFTACFALGSFLNEACAACWFTYLIFYLERVQGLTGTQAALVILSGQVADALSTPAIGALADRSRGCPALGLGRRHAFYLAGSAVVLASFTFVFGLCAPCLAPGAAVSKADRFTSFALFAAVFNVGWAAAHNASQTLVPELSPRADDRLLLNSARYVTSVCANMFVFVAFLVILTTATRANPVEAGDSYLQLTGAVLATGALTTAAFVATTARAPALRAAPAAPEGAAKAAAAAAAPSRSPRDWLRTREFWLTLAVYALSRLATTVTSLYLVSFVEVTLRMDGAAAATVPATQFAASLAAALALKRAAAAWGRRALLLGGGVAFVGACASISFIPPGAFSALIYPVVAAVGVGAATATVSVATLQSDLLGDDTASAGFVFGVMSLSDKLNAGVVILGLGIASDATRDTPGFFRTVQSVVPSAAMALALALALTTRALRAPAPAPPPGVETPNPLAAAPAPAPPKAAWADEGAPRAEPSI